MISLIIKPFFCLIIGTVLQIEGRLEYSDRETNDLEKAFISNNRQLSQTCDNCNCRANYEPFCGSNGVTYSNRCNLECAKNCNPGLRVHFEGVCPVPYNGKGSKIHHHQKGNSYYRRPQLSVPTRKPDSYFVQQQSRFKTTRPPVRTTQGLPGPPPTLHPRANLKPDARCLSCACTYDYTPICGSDGVIYGNECQFRCAQKTCNSYLTRQSPTNCWEWPEESTTFLPTFPPRPRTIPPSYGRQYGR